MKETSVKRAGSNASSDFGYRIEQSNMQSCVQPIDSLSLFMSIDAASKPAVWTMTVEYSYSESISFRLLPSNRVNIYRYDYI